MLAVKNAFQFVKWQWNRFSLFGKTMLAAYICIIVSFFTSGLMSKIFTWGGIACLTVVFLKLVFEVVGTQYKKYIEEKNDLFTTIKYSDDQDSKGTIV